MHSDRRNLTLLITLLLSCVAVGVSCRCAASDRAGLEPTVADGTHDLLLLLPAGPVHLRIEVTDGGRSLKRLREQYIERLIAALDTDGDGKVSRQETMKHPLFVSGRRFEGNKFLDSLRPVKDHSEKDLTMAVERAAGQPITFRQNSSLADQDLSVFQILDRDESGLIERAEMRTAAAQLAARDLDFDQCITFDELSAEPGRDAMDPLITVASSEPPRSIHSDILREASEPTLPMRMVRLYDRDRDAKLAAAELGWSQQACDALDSDGDGLLSVQELAGITRAKPDLWLSIDLGSGDESAVRMLSGRLADEAQQVSANVVKLAHVDTSLTVTYRHRDPLAEAKANALAVFNAIDVDANGYLDRDEIVDHQRFERYLFDAMDADGDDRVFAEEMLAYVEAYTEPASTSCQVTLFDLGSGLFSVLDTNGDGRISIRELRAVENVLLATAGTGQVVNPSQQKKAFRVEVQRGGVGLFGRVDRPEAETPTASLQAPVGPVWFQRMDRNRDGDLTWDEFLGPREVFHRLDRDQDGLINSEEARMFSQ